MIKLRLIHLDNNNNVISDSLCSYDVNISMIDKPFYATYKDTGNQLNIQFFYGQNGEIKCHYHKNQFTMYYGKNSGRIYRVISQRGHIFYDTELYNITRDAQINLTSLRGKDNIREFLKIVKSIFN